MTNQDPRCRCGYKSLVGDGCQYCNPEMHQDQLFESYLDTLRARHEQGRKEYGDRSMDKPRAELLGEMQQELVDVAGWAFFEWAKLEKMIAANDIRMLDSIERRDLLDEIRRLRADLREAMELLNAHGQAPDWLGPNKKKAWDRSWGKLLERHKEKSDG